MKIESTKFWLGWLLILLLLPGCVMGRKRPDFSQFEKLENQNSTKVENQSENQLEFPVTPGATATASEKTEVRAQAITLVLGGAGVSSFATVGLLKRFKEEGIKVDAIVATGWPALFAIGYGFFKSVHDLEWFAMRLQEKDFSKACAISAKGEMGKISPMIENSLKFKDLRDLRVPVIIAAQNSELGGDGVFDSGDWRDPLLRTMAVPGLYRPFPEMEESAIRNLGLKALDIGEGKKRGATHVVAVNMYPDYLEYYRVPKKETGSALFRMSYLALMRRSLREELQDVLTVPIELKSNPLDFSKKRTAIFAGSAAASKIIKNVIN